MTIILDPKVLTDLGAKLATLSKLCNRAVFGLDIMSARPVLASVPEHYHNIAFVLAYEALEDALEHLRDGGAFACKSNKLSDLMTKSQPSVAWLDFATIDEGRDKRNDLAHRGVLVANPECLRFVDAVTAQLRDWGVT